MVNPTHDVKMLVADALLRTPQPYPMNVTLLVALVIEQDPSLRQRYEHEKATLGVDTTNQAIGRYTKQLTGLKSGSQVNAGRKTIIGSYTELHH